MNTKSKCAIAIAALASSVGFADETNRFPLEQRLPQENLALHRDYVYVQLMAADTDPFRTNPIVPGIGIGYRLVNGHHGMDLSSSYSRGKVWGDEELGKTAHFITVPKVSYLYYFTPGSEQSLYAGAGIGLGHLHQPKGDSVKKKAEVAQDQTAQESKDEGRESKDGGKVEQKEAAAASAVATAEPAKTEEATKSAIEAPRFTGMVAGLTLGLEMNRRSFIQLDVSQPALSINDAGKLPGPMATLSVGAGF